MHNYSIPNCFQFEEQDHRRELIKNHLPKDEKPLEIALKVINDKQVYIDEVSCAGEGWYNPQGRYFHSLNAEHKYKYKIIYNHRYQLLYNIEEI